MQLLMFRVLHFKLDFIHLSGKIRQPLFPL